MGLPPLPAPIQSTRYAAFTFFAGFVFPRVSTGFASYIRFTGLGVALSLSTVRVLPTT
jgi:hypothetical protein